MLNIPAQVERTIKAYLENISRIIPIDKAILFGSYAKGNYSVDSDIDLAIFSSYFDDKDRLESFRLLFLEAMEFPFDIQPQPFTKDEMLKPDGIVTEIINTGVEIKM